MTETQAKELNKQLPEAERDWIDAIPEIFGRKWKEEGMKEGKKEGKKEGIKEGMEKTTHAVTIKTIQKFPDWSDVEVSEFVGVKEQFVQKVRRELATIKQG